MRKRDRYGALVNRAMAEKLVAGKAIDISNLPRHGKNHYVMEKPPRLNKDYCDAFREAWVWSIGRRHRDGVILASLGSDLYQNPDFECLWLR